MNILEKSKRTVAEFTQVPVSVQGQVTLPKPLREKLGIKNGETAKVNFILKEDGTIVVEPVPTVDSLFGILAAEFKAKNMDPVNVYDIREEMANERLKELGYTPKNNFCQ